jgi:hypothetical protein
MNTGRYIKSFPFEFVFDFLRFNVVSLGFRKRVIIDNLHIYSGEHRWMATRKVVFAAVSRQPVLQDLDVSTS